MERESSLLCSQEPVIGPHWNSLFQVFSQNFNILFYLKCIIYCRLFDWRPDKLRGERSKHEKVVIVKNLFDPAVFDKEVSLLLEYQQDLREECSKCGDVRRVVIYDVSQVSSFSVRSDIIYIM